MKHSKKNINKIKHFKKMENRNNLFFETTCTDLYSNLTEDLYDVIRKIPLEQFNEFGFVFADFSYYDISIELSDNIELKINYEK
jgi:hypothetical protein